MKKVIIIGAGISGLSAGCYAQKNGYDSTLYEMHNEVGGLCTSWEREDYMIDGCIDWLIGSNPDSVLYDIYNEIGAFDDIRLVHHDYVMHIESENNRRLVLYSDVDRLEKHLLELAPIDAVLIKEMTDAIRKCALFSKTKQTIFIDKFNQMSMFEFLEQFKDPFLKEALSVCFLPLSPKEYTVGALIARLSFYNRKDACWPEGGSLVFAKNIESKYISLGGHITLGAKVKKILIDNNKAIGIELENGTKQYADYVISTIDGYSALFELLGDKYLDEQIKLLYSKELKLPTSMQISLGVKCDLSDTPHSIALKLNQPFKVGEVNNSHIYVKHFCYDTIMSHKNKSMITSIIKTDYTYWEALYHNMKDYIKEKERLAGDFVKIMTSRIPQIESNIEVIDIATPITYYRYTGIWGGSYMGWWNKSKDTVPFKIPVVENLILAGQWTKSTGGIVSAIMSGRESIQCFNN